MSDTAGLLARITSLRQRLERAQGLLRDAAEALPQSSAADLAEQLEHEVLAGTRVQSFLDGSLRNVTGALTTSNGDSVPTLTGRARQLLDRGRSLVVELRQLADDPLVPADDLEDPLVQGVRRSSAMIEATLRLVQSFPEAPSGQLRLAEGVDGLLGAIAERVGALAAAVRQRRLDHDQIETLAHWLAAIHDGRAVAPDPLLALADAIVANARDATPLRFLAAGNPATVDWLPRHIAAHSLIVAQVVARLTAHDRESPIAPETIVLSALVHDLGMLAVPSEILANPGSLSDEQKRLIERHPHAAAERIARVFSETVGLADAVGSHHERNDGSGYPAGLTGSAIAPAAKLLAVADVYAALASPRPHRGAADPRTAMTDTLMQAECGALDRAAAERLLALTFYPVGSVVELSDGSVGRVVAVHPPRADVHAPARPVVQLLTDSRGGALPHSPTVDLNQCEGRAVVRTVPIAQRRRLFASRYPEWAA